MLSGFKSFFFVLVSVLSVATAFSRPARTTSFVSSTTAWAAASSTDVNMPQVKAGDSIPSVTLKELVTGEASAADIDIAAVIKGKKVAIFGVPGAFTPTCSKGHLPSFMDAQDELKAKGVDLTICIATNDAYVMEVST